MIKCLLINSKNFEVYLPQLESKSDSQPLKNYSLMLLKVYSETSSSLEVYTDMEFKLEILVASTQ